MELKRGLPFYNIVNIINTKFTLYIHFVSFFHWSRIFFSHTYRILTQRIDLNKKRHVSQEKEEFTLDRNNDYNFKGKKNIQKSEIGNFNVSFKHTRHK